MYDPAFQIGNFTPEELIEGISNAQILIGNDYEIALIEDKLKISHEELIVMVPILITTLGSKGSIIEARNDAMHIKPAKPKNTSDPTGAGDAFAAGFLFGRSLDLAPERSLRLGNRVAEEVLGVPGFGVDPERMRRAVRTMLL